MEVACFGILSHHAVHGNYPDRERNGVGHNDAEYPPYYRDGQRLCQELNEDVAPARSQRFFYADLTGALRHRDQHDVHQLYATDAQGERGHEGQQHLEGHGDDLPVVHRLHGVPDEDCPGVLGIKAVIAGQHAADVAFNLLVLGAVVADPDAVEVAHVFQVAHGAERNVDDLVDIVVALLHVRLEHADDLKGDAVNADVLAQGKLSGKKLGLGIRTQHRHAVALHLIFGSEEPAAHYSDRPDVLNLRGKGVGGKLEGAVFMLHIGLQPALGRDVAHQRHQVLNVLHVIESETDLRARLGAARLQRGAAGPDAHHLHAKVGKHIVNGLAESRAIGQQQHHRRDAPGHAQHGQRRAPAVVPHGGIGLSEKIAGHENKLLAANF